MTLEQVCAVLSVILGALAVHYARLTYIAGKQPNPTVGLSRVALLRKYWPALLLSSLSLALLATSWFSYVWPRNPSASRIYSEMTPRDLGILAERITAHLPDSLRAWEAERGKWLRLTSHIGYQETQGGIRYLHLSSYDAEDPSRSINVRCAAPDNISSTFPPDTTVLVEGQLSDIGYNDSKNGGDKGHQLGLAHCEFTIPAQAPRPTVAQ